MAAPKAPRLFLDMDGVFSDFELGYQIYRHRAGERVQSAELMSADEWSSMFKQNPNFFADLPPMPGSLDLWNFIRGDYLKRIGQRIPIFLTGCPTGKNRLPAEKGKSEWIARNLLNGPIENVHVISVAESATEADKDCYLRVLDLYLKHEKDYSAIVIFCKASQKQFFSGPNQMLLDDKKKNGDAWEAAGGIFLHHLSAPEIIETANGEDYSRYLNQGYRNSKSAEAVGISLRELNSRRGGGRRHGTRRLKRRRRQTRK